MAPEPSDVNFSSFSNETANLAKGKALLGRLFVACVFFFFLPVVCLGPKELLDALLDHLISSDIRLLL